MARKAKQEARQKSLLRAGQGASSSARNVRRASGSGSGGGSAPRTSRSAGDDAGAGGSRAAGGKAGRTRKAGRGSRRNVAGRGGGSDTGTGSGGGSPRSNRSNRSNRRGDAGSGSGNALGVAKAAGSRRRAKAAAVSRPPVYRMAPPEPQVRRSKSSRTAAGSTAARTARQLKRAQVAEARAAARAVGAAAAAATGVAAVPPPVSKYDRMLALTRIQHKQQASLLQQQKARSSRTRAPAPITVGPPPFVTPIVVGDGSHGVVPARSVSDRGLVSRIPVRHGSTAHGADARRRSSGGEGGGDGFGQRRVSGSGRHRVRDAAAGRARGGGDPYA